MAEQENNKQGIILDLRYNTGGNVHDEVLRFCRSALTYNGNIVEESVHRKVILRLHPSRSCC
ncbi:S41 family peptidase [Sphingobacterium sp. E70]|uniref:S41 family peptidase n=1 Tax=Sphingobacterium sp. E70 TaxID=2853439 RepID=UPI00211C33B9|nr:S41 family peptidase [Sphingobacterium sp. E70]